MKSSEEHILHDLFADEVLPDDGFSRSVLEGLPLRRQSHLRRWLSLGVSTAIALLVGLQGEVPVDLYAGASEIASACMQEIQAMGVGMGGW